MSKYLMKKGAPGKARKEDYSLFEAEASLAELVLAEAEVPVAYVSIGSG